MARCKWEKSVSLRTTNFPASWNGLWESLRWRLNHNWERKWRTCSLVWRKLCSFQHLLLFYLAFLLDGRLDMYLIQPPQFTYLSHKPLSCQSLAFPLSFSLCPHSRRLIPKCEEMRHLQRPCSIKKKDGFITNCHTNGCSKICWELSPNS